MFELEDSLKAKETEELQRAVRNNELIPEAAAIASKILTSRKAEIPTPMTDAEMESVDKAIVRASNMKFLAAAAFLLGCKIAHSPLFDILAKDDLPPIRPVLGGLADDQAGAELGN